MFLFFCLFIIMLFNSKLIVKLFVHLIGIWLPNSKVFCPPFILDKQMGLHLILNLNNSIFAEYKFTTYRVIVTILKRYVFSFNIQLSRLNTLIRYKQWVRLRVFQREICISSNMNIMNCVSSNPKCWWVFFQIVLNLLIKGKIP